MARANPKAAMMITTATAANSFRRLFILSALTQTERSIAGEILGANEIGAEPRRDAAAAIN
jgi:hypothetical protein